MYTGVPPLTGVGVNVTLVPLHTGETGFALMLTAGLTTGLKVSVMVFDVAVTGLAQAAFDIIIQFTCAPLFRYADENVLPLPA